MKKIHYIVAAFVCMTLCSSCESLEGSPPPSKDSVYMHITASLQHAAVANALTIPGQAL